VNLKKNSDLAAAHVLQKVKQDYDISIYLATLVRHEFGAGDQYGEMDDYSNNHYSLGNWVGLDDKEGNFKDIEISTEEILPDNVFEK